jgi:hypothetical protein
MPHPAELERRTSTGRRWTCSVALMAAAALLAVGTVTPAAAAPKTPAVPTAAADRADGSQGRTARESARLAEGLAAALRSAGFDQLVDFTVRSTVWRSRSARCRTSTSR